MNKIKDSSLLKRVTLKHKVTIFFIFYFIINVMTFSYVYESLNMPSLVNYVSDMNVDGTDFRLITNIFIGGFNGVILMISLIFNFIINLLLILITLAIFNIIYFRTICIEKKKFISYVKAIIWVVPLIGILINICLILIYKSFNMTMVLIIILMYFPLPILTYVSFFNRLNKAV